VTRTSTVGKELDLLLFVVFCFWSIKECNFFKASNNIEKSSSGVHDVELTSNAGRLFRREIVMFPSLS
jgi:hypothetical protein